MARSPQITGGEGPSDRGVRGGEARGQEHLWAAGQQVSEGGQQWETGWERWGRAVVGVCIRF